MNNIDLQLTLRSHSNCINDIYYIFFIKINNLGNIDIQEKEKIYDINTGYIFNGNNKKILIINTNKQISEYMMLFLYKTFKNFEYAYNLRNFILNILPIIL
jgi:hypothetical protein